MEAVVWTVVLIERNEVFILRPYSYSDATPFTPIVTPALADPAALAAPSTVADLLAVADLIALAVPSALTLPSPLVK